MSSPRSPNLQHRFACLQCSRRKVKCDRREPCATCVKTEAQCSYQPPPPSQRHRKRPADEDLASRISHYERLLRQNGIEFGHSDNSWIPVTFEAKLPARSHEPSPVKRSPSPAAFTQEALGQNERSLWADLHPALQTPPSNSNAKFASVEEAGDNPAGLLTFATPRSIESRSVHPEPRHILKLWQIFVDNTNPLLKIVHVPTLQQRVFESSWNPGATTPQTDCIMWAVYLLAAVSLSPDQCQSMFEEDRNVLIRRYRAGAARALVSAGLNTTRDLDVLQAFVMFLCADPDSEETMALTAVAVRLGHKLGLHLGLPKLSFFEREMRIRLWWQIRTLDARGRLLSKGPIPAPDFGDIRLPLNVNDSELHPDMENCPVEHAGATEMIYCLMKYEAGQLPKPHRADDAKIIGPPAVTPSAGRGSKLALRLQAVAELERVYEDKYLGHCDPRIPLHFLAITMARLAVCRLRFMTQHPRNRGNEPITKEENNVIFVQAVTLLRLESDSRKTQFASQLLSHLARAHLDALVFVVSELRQRVRGERVVEAWKLIAEFYESSVNDIYGCEAFHNALDDLVLEAWQSRRRELVEGQGAAEDDVTPQFVVALQAKRQGVPDNGFGNSADARVRGDGRPAQHLNTEASRSTGLASIQDPFLGMQMGVDGVDLYGDGLWDSFIRM